jgi:hypothetical protein
MAVRNIPLGYIGDRQTGPERSVIPGRLPQLSALAIAVADGRRLTGVPPRLGRCLRADHRRSARTRAVRGGFCPPARSQRLGRPGHHRLPAPAGRGDQISWPSRRQSFKNMSRGWHSTGVDGRPSTG